jgi:SAM-dependent methyltransferase/4-amino-4-deoxy-L-arabinose transferase-like glycosyltransferase
MVERDDDFLWRHLKSVPAFRALLRAVEARFFQVVDLPGPVLDLGCGDGHFAQMTFDAPLDAGIDPWWNPLRKAAHTERYQVLVQGLGDRMPFPDHYFASAFSNSVLEHIPDVQAVLNETSRVLQPNGRFLITMPSHYFTQYLGGAELLQNVGLGGLAPRYRNFFNRISRHAHSEPPDWWADRLAQAGFQVERWQYYFSRDALRALEWGHVQGLPSAILHALTGHWVIAPWEENLQRTEQWLRPYYEEPFNPNEGAYLLIVARKVSDEPIAAHLPAPRPFALELLQQAEQQAMVGTSLLEPVESETAVQSATDLTQRRRGAEVEAVRPRPAERAESTTRSPLITAALILFGLMAALVGQSSLIGNPTAPGSGLRWYGLSLAIFGLLAWRQWGQPRDWSWPQLNLAAVPRRRWLYLTALLLGLIAYGQSGWLLALLFWVGSIGVAYYSLHESSGWRPQITLFQAGAAGLLFLAALLLRALGLSQHPFILNGLEANLGLDALRVLNGAISSPFSTGWLDNPTLPTFLMAGPIALLGPSTLSLRLLSPLVGALTVTAVYLLGERLYGRIVGLIAAVLLLGSHFHLHYSRLGLTNIYDPLLVWLALGLMLLAWRRHEAGQPNRHLWLLAGLIAGLNAYVFTGARLLTFILLGLAICLWLWQRPALRQQLPAILAGLGLALIVALPQLLHYQANPERFWERTEAVSIGLLIGPGNWGPGNWGQEDWLAQEAARLGQGQGEVLRQHAWQALLAFNATLDRSNAYRSAIPLLSTGMALLFVLGLGVCLAQIRQPRYALLLLWVLLTLLLGGVLTDNPPQSHRLVVATPALALLAALGLWLLGRLLLSLWQEAGDEVAAAYRPYLLPALLVVATLLTLSDLSYYFGRYRAQPDFADLNTEVADRMGHYLNELGEEWSAYFYGPPRMYVGFPNITFLASGHQSGYNLFDMETQDGPLPTAVTNKRVFIYLPERLPELAAIQNQYPDGSLRQFDGYYSSPLFFAYEVEP